MKKNNSKITIILSSLLFWAWLGKDLLANLLMYFGLKQNNLILVIFIVFILISLLRISDKHPNKLIHKKLALPQKHFAWYFLALSSIIISIVISQPTTSFTEFKFINFIISSIISYIVCYNFLRCNPTENKLFLITGLIWGLVPYYITGFSIFIEGSDIGWRNLGLSIGSYNDYYAIIWLFSLANYFLKKNKYNLYLLIVITLLSWPMIILLSTRIMLFLMVGCSCIILYLLKKVINKRQFRFLISISVIFLSLFLYINYLFIQANPQNRVASLLNDGVMQTITDNPRSQQFKEAIADFSDSPIIGLGFSHFNRRNDPNGGGYPHNFFLELMSEMGILGLIIFTLPIISVIRIIRKWGIRNQIGYNIFPIILFIYSFLQLLQGYTFFNYPTFWIGLTWMLWHSKYIDLEAVNNS